LSILFAVYLLAVPAATRYHVTSCKWKQGYNFMYCDLQSDVAKALLSGCRYFVIHGDSLGLQHAVRTVTCVRNVHSVPSEAGVLGSSLLCLSRSK
jgi:hypothetical protein